jgi:hypothetical protein
MPRKIIRSGIGDERLASLLLELEKELSKPADVGQPLIIERHMGFGNAVQVTVVWDRFHEIPESDRTALILSAYEQCFGQESRDQVTLAIGLTVPEAVELGLLPYAVVSARRRDDTVTLDQYRQAMISEGASLLDNRELPQLRFASEDEATSSVSRLEKAAPGSFWIVTRDVAAVQ